MRATSTSAVSGCPRKVVLVGGIQIPVGSLENILRPSLVGIGECAATRHHANAQMGKLAGFGEHGVCNLAQGIEAFDHSIEHNDQMLPRIKVLHIPFTTVFTAEFENFRLVKQKNQLTIHRLSDKMCTFVHVIDVL